jgi:transposase
VEQVAAAGLRWPLPTTLTDRVLEAMLYPGHGRQQGARRKAEPDWASVHHELRRPGVTLMLLWEEYRQREPDFDRNKWPTSIGMPGRHHRNTQIGAQGPDAAGLAEQPIPSVTAGVDDLASGLENAVREAIVSEMQP